MPSHQDALTFDLFGRVVPIDRSAHTATRLADMLLNNGGCALEDVELLELLLSSSRLGNDARNLASRLVATFGTYSAAISATKRELEAVPGICRPIVTVLMAVRESALRLSKASIQDKSVLGNWDQLISYLSSSLSHERTETFRVLFLDAKNRLLADELHGRGTVNHVSVYTREVVARAIELFSCALICVHNHPSGESTPSEADVEMTFEVKRALATVHVLLHDHIIIGRDGWTSLSREGLL